MGEQIRNGLWKENKLFTRTGRLIALIAIFVVLGIFDIAYLSGMQSIAKTYDETIEALTEETGTSVDFSMQGMLDNLGYADMLSTSAGVSAAAVDVASLGLLIMIILLIPAAGDEQKKRSVIIPSCAGLTPTGYVLPKFIYYNVFALLLGVLNSVTAYIAGLNAFDVHDISFGGVIAVGLLNGLLIAFLASLHMCIGISLGKPGIAAIITIIVSVVVPLLFEVLEMAGKYNPFAIRTLISGVIAADTGKAALTDVTSVANFIGTVAITILLITVMYFISLLARKSTLVDNSGDDILL